LDQTTPNRAAPYRHSLALQAIAGGALNTEAMTMSVTDLTPKRSRHQRGHAGGHRVLAPAPFKTSAVVSQRSLAFIRVVYLLAIPYSLSCLAAALAKPLTSAPERIGTIKWPVRCIYRPIKWPVRCIHRPIKPRGVPCVSVSGSIMPIHRVVGCVRIRPIIGPRAVRCVPITIVWAMVHGVTVSAAAAVTINRRITVSPASRSRRRRKCETRAYDRHRCILLSVPHRHISCGNLSAFGLGAC
jgi:hypothetical protein